MISLRWNLLDRCFTVIGILLIFLRNLFILAEALNLPCWINVTASWTGLESGSSSIAFLASLSRGYSDLMATAIARASSLHGLHSPHPGLSLEEWNCTGRSSLPLMASIVCPMPGELCAASVFITKISSGLAGTGCECYLYVPWPP